MKTLIIAEAGVNHNGEQSMALALVDAAADAGADIVKFQTFSADRLVSKGAPKAGYQKRTTEAGESQHEMLRRLELTRETHHSIIARCKTRGIEFLSSAFDLESVDLLAELGVARFKIPSGELTNVPYLRKVAGFGKPLILSTGMASMEEVEAALAVLESAGASRERITVLHCTSEYPAPLASVNLRAMGALRDRLGVAVGYSDHTVGIEIAIAAVALGATVIEKHFTIDRTLPGPDHAASLEPRELGLMVATIRNVETALGSELKRPSEAESANARAVRKSLVAARPIKAGELFTEHNLTAKRPGGGLSPMEWDNVIGRSAGRDYQPDEQIER